ncbi:MAG: hypothetical protein ACYC7E_08350 [Armatimonadota bacterium]
MSERSPEELAREFKSYLAGAYPDMQITVIPNYNYQGTEETAVFFVEEQFAVLYPVQRFHYINHRLPQSFLDTLPENTYFYELAPGERPEDLRYPDDEIIEAITPDVLKTLEVTGFFAQLDDLFCPQDPSQPRASCHGDFSISKVILARLDFEEVLFFDIFHVLMDQGGFCDCEILCNVKRDSRFSGPLWQKLKGNADIHSLHRQDATEAIIVMDSD